MIHLNSVYLYAGQAHRCVMVNESRALLVPVTKLKVRIKPRFGPPVTFTKALTGVSVSPNSELERIK